MDETPELTATTRQEDVLNAKWVAVPPQSQSDGGWTVWTRGLEPNFRICWLPAFPESEGIAERIVADHAASHSGRNAQ